MLGRALTYAGLGTTVWLAGYLYGCGVGERDGLDSDPEDTRGTRHRRYLDKTKVEEVDDSANVHWDYEARCFYVDEPVPYG